MLKKLLHYEWLSISKYLVPILIFTPVLGILSGFFGFLANFFSDKTLLAIGLWSIYGFSLLALVLSAAMLPILLIYRFWSSLFSDGGYLTLMLPVSKKSLLFSKLFNALFANFAHITVLLFSLVFAIGVPMLNIFSPITVAEAFFSMVAELLSLTASNSSFYVLVILEVILYIFSYVLLEYTVLYLGITLGAVIFKGKGRIAGAFLFVFVTNSAVSTVISILEVIVSGGMFGFGLLSVTSQFPIHFFLTGESIVRIGFSIGLFLLNANLTERKVNLP